MSEGDCIHIEQLLVIARVGVTENERKAPQRVSLNITVWPRADFAALHDDISETINYSAIAASVRSVIEQAEFNLIETLADRVASQLVSEFPVRRATVEVRKFVLPGTDFVSVTTSRTP
jgi:dihydroneopterin aldolase